MAGGGGVGVQVEGGGRDGWREGEKEKKEARVLYVNAGWDCKAS